MDIIKSIKLSRKFRKGRHFGVDIFTNKPKKIIRNLHEASLFKSIQNSTKCLQIQTKLLKCI